MDPFFPHIWAVQRAEMHQVSLRINSQPGSPCHSVPNPVFDTEPGPMSENEDGALSNTEPGPMANNLPASPIMSASEPPYLPTEILSMIIACSLNQDMSRHAGIVQSSLSLVLRPSCNISPPSLHQREPRRGFGT